MALYFLLWDDGIDAPLYYEQSWLGSVVVGRRTGDRKIASSTPGRCIAGSAFHPSGVGKSSTSLLAGVKAGRVHLCRVAGNTV